jgi:hypothetical protein
MLKQLKTFKLRLGRKMEVRLISNGIHVRPLDCGISRKLPVGVDKSGNELHVYQFHESHSDMCNCNVVIGSNRKLGKVT